MNKEIIEYIKLLSDNNKIQEILLLTIGKILLANGDSDFYLQNYDKIIHIKDWISSVVENNEQWKNPRVLTIEALNNTADKYFEKKNNKLQTIDLDETHEKLIADLGDYYIVQMLTTDALDNESKQMQHCIGHGFYDENLNDHNYSYLSLRDKFNKAHVTLEINDNEILQFQGKQNKIPEKKYLEKLIPWLNEKEYKLELNRYNLILNKRDNKIYSVCDMPDNCEIDGSVFVDCAEIDKLPKNLVVNGNIGLHNCQKIKEFPQGFVVNGNLYLDNLKVEFLSEDLKVSQNLEIVNSNIKKLPNNLKVRDLIISGSFDLEELPDSLIIEENLVLMGSKIKKISDKISIGKDIDLRRSEIEILPDNLHVKGILNLNFCEKLKMIPKNLKVDGRLYLNKVNIKEIPADIDVGNNLDLRYSEIEKLPDNLHVKGDLFLNDTKIKKLPKNLKVDGFIDMQCSLIEEIPNDIKIGQSINLISSNIKKIPENLVVNGDLNLFACNNIKELPDNLIVKGTLNINQTKIKKLSKNIVANYILISKEQINLIKQDTLVQKIMVENMLHYEKNEFIKYVSKHLEKCKKYKMIK